MNSRSFSAVSGRNVASTYSTIPATATSARWTSILPASTLDRSRMSLISWSRSVPALWMVCANSTCRLLRLPSGLSVEQLREDQQRVERRAQLVRHVREELRLVARRQRELLGAVLERAAGVLDLEVLDLDRAVLAGQQARLLLQLGVALLELALLGLQLARLVLQLTREPLGLDQQRRRARAGDDRVERDADDLHQLLEEVHVHGGERLERRELHHAEHLLLEDHRQDHDLQRRRLARARTRSARSRAARR